MLTLLLNLFLMFAKLCAFAFGGGYVMIPSLMKASEVNNWLTAKELTEVIALAGMSPGPVAVNAAVGFGYKVAGFQGAAACFLGIAVPCAAIVILTASFFFKVSNHPWMRAVLYGLNPVVIGTIIDAAINIAVKNNIVLADFDKLLEKGFYVNFMGINLFEVKSILITVVTFILLCRTKISPLFIILGAGLLGIFIF